MTPSDWHSPSLLFMPIDYLVVYCFDRFKDCEISEKMLTLEYNCANDTYKRGGGDGCGGGGGGELVKGWNQMANKVSTPTNIQTITYPIHSLAHSHLYTPTLAIDTPTPLTQPPTQFTGITRKVERDWNKCYLAREINEQESCISWKFDLTALDVQKCLVSISAACFHSGEVRKEVAFVKNQMRSVRELGEGECVCIPLSQSLHLPLS